MESSTASATSRRTLRVAEKNLVADSIVELVLRDPAGQPLPPWTPGAHIGLTLKAGLVRQYSLCGDVDDRSCYKVAVLREPRSRGGSSYVHEEISVGDSIEIMAPRNNFELRDAESYLFIAGGIGLTPLLPMLIAAQSRGTDWRLVYGGRTRSSMAYADELLTRFEGRVTILPQDETGHLPIENLIAGVSSGHLAYCCGPEALLAAVEDECARKSFSGLHIERFTPKDDPAAPTEDDQPFEVHLQISDRTLTVPVGRSILDVVEEAGIQVDSSCRDGTCATCETSVIEGKCDHRDSLLSDAEREANDTVMICVSRACGKRLVLDL